MWQQHFYSSSSEGEESDMIVLYLLLAWEEYKNLHLM